MFDNQSLNHWNDGYDCGLNGGPKMPPIGAIKIYWDCGWEKGSKRRIERLVESNNYYKRMYNVKLG